MKGLNIREQIREAKNYLLAYGQIVQEVECLRVQRADMQDFERIPQLKGIIEPKMPGMEQGYKEGAEEYLGMIGELRVAMVKDEKLAELAQINGHLQSLEKICREILSSVSHLDITMPKEKKKV